MCSALGTLSYVPMHLRDENWDRKERKHATFPPGVISSTTSCKKDFVEVWIRNPKRNVNNSDTTAPLKVPRKKYQNWRQ